MKEPDEQPDDEFEQSIRETFDEMHTEALITPLVLEVPDEVIEAIETYEKAHSVNRGSLIGLAMKAQKGRIHELSQMLAWLIDDPEAFAWLFEDPLLCVAIAFMQEHAFRWADKVREKYGLDEEEDEPDPADWWKAP
jgi:hypothetical protein